VPIKAARLRTGTADGFPKVSMLLPMLKLLV